MTTGAHPVYVHDDGKTCIRDERGAWFTPLDAGGEGYDCELRHGMTADDLDPVATRGLNAVRQAHRDTRRAHTPPADTNPVRARAIERARTERTTKEDPA